MKYLIAFLGVLCLNAQQIDWNTQVRNKLAVPNDAVTGTVQFGLAKINSSGNAILISTSDTAVPVWIVTSSSSRTGNAQLAIGGQVLCTMDGGGATLGDFIVASTTIAGDCHDAGAGAPTSVWIVGIAATPAIGGAVSSVAIPAGYLGSTGGGSGVTNLATSSPISGGPITTTGTISCPTCVTSAASLTANGFVYGAGSQGSAATAACTSSQIPLGGSPPTCGALNLATMTTGVLPFAGAFPTGSQAQILKIKPNQGNTTTLEWTNPVMFSSADYNFAAQAPGGSLTASTPATVALSPCPLGVAGADTGHRLYVSAGTGTAEAVLITGGTCTSGASSGNVTFTPANNHSGSWTIQSATSGIQEAYNASSGAEVYVPAGTWPIYGPVTLTANGTIRGAGTRTTVLQAQGATVGVFDATGGSFEGNAILNLAISSTVQQTAGGFGIRIGNSSEVSGVTVTGIYCEFMYDCIIGVNGSHVDIRGNKFFSFSHNGIIVADTTNPDFNGGFIIGNDFFVQSLASAANAAITISSTSSLRVADNVAIGGAANQLNYCYQWNATASGGYLTMVGNKCEKSQLEGFSMSGALGTLNMTGNTFSNTIPAANWNAVHINATSGTPALQLSTITANNIKCGSTGNNGIYLQGSYQTLSIASNQIDSCNIGINVNSAPAGAILLSLNLITNSGTVTIAANTSTSIMDTNAVTFANMTGAPLGLSNAANGSSVYCSDCNATCAAGASTGRRCQKANGAWIN